LKKQHDFVFITLKKGDSLFCLLNLRGNAGVNFPRGDLSVGRFVGEREMLSTVQRHDHEWL